MKHSPSFKGRSAAIILSLCLAVAACGSDSASPGDAVSGEGASGGDEAASTAAPSTAVEPAVADEAEDPSSAATEESVDGDDGVPEADFAFPVTVEHKLGTITIESMPERVISVGYKDQDWLYEFGVQPIAVREWYGSFPGELNPWATGLAKGTVPQVLVGDLNFEEIASMKPDLIVGVYSGMSEEEYALLSAIAPTLAGPVGTQDFEEPWRDMTRLIGSALGQADRADEVVLEVEGLYAEVRAAHPEFAGVQVVAGAAWGDTVGVYDSGDPRSQLLAELGFVIPARFDELTAGEFWFELSPETYGELDAAEVAVLLSFVEGEEGRALLQAEPVYASTRLHAEDRTVFLDTVDSDVAFSFLSPLSIRYLLSLLVPALEAAVDGDVATKIPALPQYAAE